MNSQAKLAMQDLEMGFNGCNGGVNWCEGIKEIRGADWGKGAHLQAGRSGPKPWEWAREVRDIPAEPRIRGEGLEYVDNWGLREQACFVEENCACGGTYCLHWPWLDCRLG